MRNFIITWDEITYSVPTIGSVQHKGSLIVLNKEDGKCIIAPKGSDPIIVKFDEFYDLDGKLLNSDLVKELIEPYAI